MIKKIIRNDKSNAEPAIINNKNQVPCNLRESLVNIHVIIADIMPRTLYRRSEILLFLARDNRQ